MATDLRFWCALHPDVTRPVGGVKQMHRLAETLQQLGCQVRLIQDSASFHPGWFQSDVRAISCRDFGRLRLDPHADVIVMPETFVPHLPRYKPGIPKVIFNQNGSYSFGLAANDGFPSDKREIVRLYRHPDVRHVLCVSEYDHQLLARGFGLGSTGVSRIVNAIEADIFSPARGKRRQVAVMPRKNPKDVAAVMTLLHEQEWFSAWQPVLIQDRSQQEVARLFQDCAVFLSFGHPEGFGLPVAEALSCACHVIGYSGLGGRELFRLAAGSAAARELSPGDWMGFVDSMAEFNHWWQSDPRQVGSRQLKISKDVRKRYSPESMKASVAKSLAAIQDSLVA